MAKLKRVVTPEGVAHYPWLKDPDTKFVKEGEFSCNIFLDMDKAKGLMKSIDDCIQERVEVEMKDSGKKKFKTVRPYLIGGSEEDTNDVVPTGQVLFKIKQKAEIQGTPWKPVIYDAEGNIINDLLIYGGSKVEVACTLYPWYVSSTGVGVTLKLVAVKVVELQERAAPSLETMGFKKSEGFRIGDQDNAVITEGAITSAKTEDTADF
jgi:hypothetical protein|tara:strand:+ start:420 stop:1043 length:624 start_codon:yes stop_codon:yes gene_type:complete